MAIFLNDVTIENQLPIDQAVCSVSQAFRQLTLGQATNVVRKRMRTGADVLHVMWASLPSAGLIGVKSYVTAGKGVTSGTDLSLLLYSMETGALVGHLAANRLGQIRTGAATVVATKALAKKNSAILAVYGNGFQAEYQIRSLLLSLTSICEVHIVGRDPGRVERFIERLSPFFPSVSFVSSSAKKAATLADVLVTATTSANPLFRAEWLKPGVHINAIGSNSPVKCEIGRDVLEAASVIVVDDYEVAALECGDVLMNQWDASKTTAIGDILVDKTYERADQDKITIFESQGLALLDVAVGAVVMNNIHMDKINKGTELC